MKLEIIKMARTGECMTLTLAIDERDVKIAMEDPEIGMEQGGFKAIILDGQHRWEAMMELLQEIPDMIYNIWLVVYLVLSDEEIDARLKALNKRRNFSQDDTDKVATITRFFQAFDAIIKSENMRRRCVQKVRKSDIFNTPAFIKKNKHKNVQQFTDALYMIAQSRRQYWETRINETDGKIGKTVLGDVIRSTKMYQLMDETCKWLNEL
jgi:hypothetical protein